MDTWYYASSCAVGGVLVRVRLALLVLIVRGAYFTLITDTLLSQFDVSL